MPPPVAAIPAKATHPPQPHPATPSQPESVDPIRKGLPPNPKKKRVAELISAEPARSRLEAGPGGDLPELELSANQKHSSEKQDKKKSNDWLVLAAIIASLVMSTVMLMVETETSQDIQGKTNGSNKGKWSQPNFSLGS